jgi:hypothetical protein
VNREIIRLVGARTSRNRIKLSLDAVLDDGPLFVAAPRSDRRNDVIDLEKTFAEEIDSCQRNRLHLRF